MDMFRNAEGNWKPVFIDNGGNEITFEPVKQADGTYLLVGRACEKENAGHENQGQHENIVQLKGLTTSIRR